MTPQQQRDAMLNALLPVEPEPDQVIEMPEGQSAGSAHAIFIYKGEDLIGSASSFAPVENVSKKGMLTRATTNTPVVKDDVLRVTYSQYEFTSVIFVDYFGWLGNDFYNAVTVYNRYFKVVHVFPIGEKSPNCNLYERICLQTIEPPIREDRKDEQRTTEDSAGSTTAPEGATSSPTEGVADHK